MQPTPGFFLGNPMDSGSWRAVVHEVTKESDTTEQLNNNMYIDDIDDDVYIYIYIYNIYTHTRYV